MELFNKYYNSEMQFLLNLYSIRRGLTKDEIVGLARRCHVAYPSDITKKLRALSLIYKGEDGLFYKNVELKNFAAPLNLLESEYLSDICKTEEARLFLSETTNGGLLVEGGSIFDCIDRRNSVGKKQEFLSIKPELFRTLLKAIYEHRRISYDYRTSGNSDVRTCPSAIPYRIEYNVFDGRWWLITYIEKEGRTVKSKLNNILRVEASSMHGPCEEEIRAAINSNLQEEPVVLHIRNINNALERAFIVFESGQEATVTRINADEFEYSFRYYRWDESAIVRKLLYLGEMVSVISPESVKQALVSELQAALSASSPLESGCGK